MIKVVIIDDEKWIRKLIIRMLPYNKVPIEVIGEAEDGIEGLDLIKNLKPDIILTDIRMPLLSGLDLIKELNRKQPDSQIIIISGYDTFDYAHTAIKFGVVDFLLKPIEELDLEKAILKAVNNIKKIEQINKNKILKNKIRRLSMDYIEIEKSDFPNITNDKIRKSLIYINNNFQNPISLNDVSDAINMNSSYLSEQFKKEVGVGFNKYLMDLRFKIARRLLVERKDLTIGDISEITGFLDSNYFSRLFKKNYDITPQEFRNEN